MARFLVRVELHDAVWSDYEALHTEMADRGFSREVTGENGRTYQLPTAEYVIYSAWELENVRTLAAANLEPTDDAFRA